MKTEKKIESIREQLSIMASMPDNIEQEPTEVCAHLHTEIENLVCRFVEIFGDDKPRLRYAVHLAMIVKHLCRTGMGDAEQITERYKIHK